MASTEFSDILLDEPVFHDETREKRAWEDSSKERLQKEINALFSEVPPPDFLQQINESGTGVDKLNSNKKSVSNISDTSSLGLLHEMSDFSVLEIPKSVKDSNRMHSFPIKQEERVPMNDVRNSLGVLREGMMSSITLDTAENSQCDSIDLDSPDFDRKLESLFGKESHSVKSLLGESFYKASKETFCKDLPSSTFVGDSSLHNISDKLFRPPKTPIDAGVEKKNAGSVCETPFTKLLKGNRPITDVSSDYPNPFDDMSLLEMVNLSGINSYSGSSAATEDSLLKDKKFFQDEQISARSTSINGSNNISGDSAKSQILATAVNKKIHQAESFAAGQEQSIDDLFGNMSNNFLEFQRSFTDDGYQPEFMSHLEQLGIHENEFQDAEDVINSFARAEAVFNRESMIEPADDSKMAHMSIWSMANQAQAVQCPSWLMDGSNLSQISIGQVFGAKTEDLGALSEDPERPRPYFGANVKTPPKLNAANDSNYKDLSGLPTVPEESAESLAGSGCKDFSFMSRLCDQVSFSDETSLMISKLLLGKDKKNPSKVLKEDVQPIQPSTFVHKSNLPKDDGLPAPSNDSSTLHNIAFDDKKKAATQEAPPDKQEISDVESDSDISSEMSEFIKRDNLLKIKKRLQFGCGPTKVLHRSVSLDAAVAGGLEDGSNSPVTSSTPAMSQQTDSVSGSQRTSAALEKPCSSASCCQHSYPTSASHSNSICSSYTCSSSNMSEQNKPVAAACISHIQQQLLTGCMPISGSSDFPTVNQAHTYNCMKDFSNCNASLKLATMYMQPNNFTRSLPNFNISGSSNVAVVGPSEFEFPCTCIGDNVEATLTFQNALPFPLFHHLKLLYAEQDKTPVPIELLGLTIPKCIESVGLGSLKILMSYAPKIEGEVKVDLAVISSQSADSGALQAVVGHLLVKLIMFSEQPSFNLWSSKGEELNFGCVHVGRSTSEYITIQNMGKADIPLHLTIERDQEVADSAHCFSFNLNNSALKDNSKVATVLFSSPKYVFCRVKGDTSQQKCHIPVTFTAGKVSSHEGKAETISSCIVVKIEGSQMKFRTINVIATVGTAFLSLKKTRTDPLVLRTHRDGTVTEKLTLLNSGTLPVKADLAVLHDDDKCFSVLPETAEVWSKGEFPIAITFKPAYEGRFEGILQAAISNSNEVFDLVPVVGEVKSRLPPKYLFHLEQTAILKDFVLESNTRYLAFGGVQLERALIKQFTVRNPSASEVLKVTTVFEGSSRSFVLIDGKGSKKICLNLALMPKASQCLKVMFYPRDKKFISNKLLFKQSTRRGKFSIPVFGYGGISDVKLVTVLEERENTYQLPLNHVFDSEPAFNNICLCNVGKRPAFVKLIAVQDDNYNIEEPKIKIQPSELILKEQDSQSIRITYTGDPQQDISSTLCCGRIFIYSGDEVMRQNFRKSRQDRKNIPIDGPLSLIDFNVFYVGEESTPTEDPFPNAELNNSLFYPSLHKMCIKVSLDCSSASDSLSFNVLSYIQDSRMTHDMSASVRSTSLALSPPVKDDNQKSLYHHNSIHNSNMLPVPDKKDNFVSDKTAVETTIAECVEDQPHEITEYIDKNAVYSISPDLITLDSESRDGRLVIINHSSKDIKFKLDWSANQISASPSQGTIFAKKEIGIRVKAICHFDGRLPGSFKGFIKVLSCGVEKQVPVEIHKGKSLNCKANSGDNGAKLSKDVVLSKPTSYIVFPDNVILKDAKVGSQSSTSFYIKNVGQEILFWSMLSSMEDKPSSSKHQSLIQLIPSYGAIQPLQSAKIVATFTPKKEGRVTEQWKVTTECGTQTKFDIRFLGFGQSSQSIPGNLEMNTDSSSRLSIQSKRNSGVTLETAMGNLDVEPKVLEFPLTDIGGKSFCDILMKNHDNSECKMTIVQPNPPFFVSHSCVTVKPKFFCKLPVYFSPNEVGDYEGTLIFALENSELYNVILQGSCKV